MIQKRIDWEKVINGYDPKTETVEQYCSRMEVSSSAYYAKRKKFHNNNSDTSVKVLPAVVERTDLTTVEINHIPLCYDSSVTDEELKRLIRLCNEL